MLPKKQCELEITEDYHGNKIVTYPTCEQEEFKFAKDCDAFDDCYDHIKDDKYKTKFALGVYSDTMGKIGNKYSDYTKTTLIIPKDTMTINKYGKYVEKAYVYDNAKTYVDSKGDVRRFNNDIKYQTPNERMWKIRYTEKERIYFDNFKDNNKNILIFEKGEETKLTNICDYKLEYKIDQIKDYIKYYH
jgi:hypothetical protein